MRVRCNNRNFHEYKRYGGRGIKICEEWNDYFSFQKWAYVNGYKDDLTIDRIDNDGDYSPDNCRWITIEEQQQNRCTSHMITFNGKTQNLTQWAKEYSITRDCLKQRIKRGWPIERALGVVI